jgi:hypothetical protein
MAKKDRKICAFQEIPNIGGEFYGRNKFANLHKIDIHRDDNRFDIQVVISAFSKRSSKGSPCCLLLTLEGAKKLQETLGKVLNPTDKELE